MTYLGTITGFLAIIVSTASFAADRTNLRLAIPLGQGTLLDFGAHNFQSGISERLNGFAQISLVSGATDPIESLRKDQADFAVVNTASLSASGAGGLDIFDLPFLFTDADDAVAVQHSAVGEKILSSLHKQGLVGLGYWNAGITQLFGAEVKTVNDLRGLNVCLNSPRSDNNVTASYAAPQIKTVSAVLEDWGAKPIVSQPTTQNTAGIEDLCSRLGVFELNLADISSWSNRLYLGSSSALLSRTGFRPNVYIIVAKERVWDELSSRVQEGLVAEIEASGSKIVTESSLREKDALVALTAKGVKFGLAQTRSSAADRAAWRNVLGIDDKLLLNQALPIVDQRRRGAPVPDKHGSVDPAVLSTPSTPQQTMLFATDRRDDRDVPRYRFANKPDVLSLGSAVIAIDASRKIADEAKSSIVREIDVKTKEEFREVLRERLVKSRRKEVIIFIHGYNNSFNDAMINSSIFNYDIKFEGVPVLYSWSSAGAIPDYPRDEDEVYAARNDFVAFLRILREIPGLQSVVIFAHSMGGRLPTFALDHMRSAKDLEWPTISQVVLAAPDIYTRTFRQVADAFKTLVHRTTIYASAFDTMLKCSEHFHSDRRVGEGGENVFVERGIDTIDVSAVEQPETLSLLGWFPCSGLGHGYYVGNLSVQEDLHELVTLDTDPLRRHGLIKKDGAEYWVFRPVRR